MLILLWTPTINVGDTKRHGSTAAFMAVFYASNFASGMPLNFQGKQRLVICAIAYLDSLIRRFPHTEVSS